jgi:hypothetical protein
LSSWAHSESNNDNPLSADPAAEGMDVDASPTGRESNHKLMQ